jgi:hypothetical protein
MALEPPRNGGYLLAAYVVAPVILLAYWLRLVRMARTLLDDRTGQLGEHRTDS